MFAFYMFGISYSNMGTLERAFLEVFTMLLSNPNFVHLEKASNRITASVWFYAYYVIFFLVMKNMFVSILMTGYDYADDHKNDENVKAKDTDVAAGGSKDEPKKENEKEKGLIQTLYTSIRVDICMKIYTALAFVSTKLVKLFLSPIITVLKDCFGSSVGKHPCAKCMDLIKLHSGGSRPPQHQKHDSSDKKEVQAAVKTEPRFDYNQILMLVYMINFIVLMYIQTRGRESLNFATTTQRILKNVTWDIAHSGGTYDSIRDFRDVSAWAKSSVMELYGDTYCETRDGSYVAVENCDSAHPHQQLIQRVNKWNIGFLQTTFVRVTIQFNCFKENEDKKARPVYEYVKQDSCKGNCFLTSDLTPCASRDCTTSLFKSNKKDLLPECLNSRGESFKTMIERTGRIIRTPGSLGPHRGHGLLAFGLGTTKTQALESLRQMEEDNFFTSDVASMTFDYVVYNGNLDMFAYNVFHFSLMPTGKLSSSATCNTLPLNLDDGGNWYYIWRYISLYLFIVYAVFSVYFIFQMVWDFKKEFQTKDQHKTFFQFGYSFFTRIWNISDSLSLMLTVCAICFNLSYRLLAFRTLYKFSFSKNQAYVINNADTVKWNISSQTDPLRPSQEDLYVFKMFENCASGYGIFLQVAALNTFFISIKVVKYVGQFEIVKIFSSTLEQGKTRILNFTVIISMLLVGSSVFVHITFGSMVPQASTLHSTVLFLLKWMFMDFDLTAMMNKNETFTIFIFVLFMMFFYFIVFNLYLATMMNTYSKQEGDGDIRKAHEEVDRQMVKCRPVYNNKQEAKQDMEIKTEPIDAHTQEYRVVVTWVKKDGIADKQKVEPGHYLQKVKGNTKYKTWKSSLQADDIWDICFKEEAGQTNDGIAFGFMDPKEEAQGLTLFGGGNSKQQAHDMKATVRNFWSKHGVTTYIHDQVTKQEKAQGEAEKPEADQEASRARDDDEQSDDEDEDGAKKQEQQEADEQNAEASTSKSARQITKEKLEALLFSRWPEGREGRKRGAQVVEHGMFPPYGVAPDAQGKEYDLDMDIDRLKPKIENMRITGEEAWLDCLMTAVERETEGYSIVAEVLRTSDMQNLEKQNSSDFFANADKAMEILEHKAMKKYYQCLQLESEGRQAHFRKQNGVLFEYVTELEIEFTKVLGSIQTYKEKKRSMLTKLAGLLDRSLYADVNGKRSGEEEDDHMAMLTRPWPQSTEGFSSTHHNIRTKPAPTTTQPLALTEGSPSANTAPGEASPARTPANYTTSRFGHGRGSLISEDMAELEEPTSDTASVVEPKALGAAGNAPADNRPRGAGVGDFDILQPTETAALQRDTGAGVGEI
eukprot:TRINITY_DN17007_c0_g1_i1.p1 TRINITY_DN17007_c0_g1~~TRINITY_DN17007_c0_g1_i1.p1  ORF type:complete len:1457 (+),score=287.55 TRINITY_DN17007_c0_g1_i1:398-4372(+)